MKVILINPDFMMYSNPPLGLAYLAAYAKKQIPDLDIKIYDQIPLHLILQKIKKEKPDIIGLPAVSLNFYKVKKMAEEIKKISKALLVLGGRHITTMPQSFEKTAFDIAVLGEGELTFASLVKSYIKNSYNLKEFKKISGLLLRNRGKIINTGNSEIIKNLDDIPLPERDLLEMRYYSIPSFSVGFVKVGSMITSRGCPYNCRFCSARQFWGIGVRFFSAERVAQEIELLYKKYEFKRIEIYDDTFSLNIDRLKRLIDILEKRNLLGKIEFICMGTARGFTEEIASLLKKLNVIEITFGFESGSERILNYLKRGFFSVQDSKKVTEICKKYKLSYSGFFMIGSPTETEEDIMKTYNFIKNYCPNFIVYQTVPFPDTDVWDYAVKNKIIKEDMYDNKNKEFIDIDTDYLLTNNMTKEKFTQLFNKINSLKVKQRQRTVLSALKEKPFEILKELGNPYFLRKIYNLKREFARRILGY